MDPSSDQDPRALVRSLAQAARDAGRPNGWFEFLYQGAQEAPERVPWFKGQPHGKLVDWIERQERPSAPGTALVTGCGWGDDAEYLASHGYRVTAFDLSPSAIEHCQERFPASRVNYQVQDLLELPVEWRGQFDLVTDIFTVQSMPPQFHPAALSAALGCVSPQGRILRCAYLREDVDAVAEIEGPPWRISLNEMRGMQAFGFELELLEQQVLEAKQQLLAVGRKEV